MWLLLVEVGFVGFILSLFGMIWRGFDRNGAAKRGAPVWFLAVALFFLLMCVSLPRVPRPDKAVQEEAAMATQRTEKPQ